MSIVMNTFTVKNTSLETKEHLHIVDVNILSVNSAKSIAKIENAISKIVFCVQTSGVCSIKVTRKQNRKTLRNKDQLLSQ